MSPSNYQRGRAFEYRARDALIKRGATYVMRAAQSKGRVDLLALWPATMSFDFEFSIAARPWLVQCKTGSARMSQADRSDLVELANSTGSVAYLAQPGPKNRGVQFINLHEKEHD